MNYPELTVSLISGQRNIDRMRDSTKQLVTMLIGLMKSCVTKKEFSGNISSPDNQITWFWFSVTEVIGIRCRVRSEPCAYTDVTPNTPLQIVEDVYVALPLLVEGLCKDFPQLVGLFTPLTKASERQF